MKSDKKGRVLEPHAMNKLIEVSEKLKNVKEEPAQSAEIVPHIIISFTDVEGEFYQSRLDVCNAWELAMRIQDIMLDHLRRPWVPKEDYR